MPDQPRQPSTKLLTVPNMTLVAAAAAMILGIMTVTKLELFTAPPPPPCPLVVHIKKRPGGPGVVIQLKGARNTESGYQFVTPGNASDDYLKVTLKDHSGNVVLDEKKVDLSDANIIDLNSEKVVDLTIDDSANANKWKNPIVYALFELKVFIRYKADDPKPETFTLQFDDLRHP